MARIAYIILIFAIVFQLVFLLYVGTKPAKSGEVPTLSVSPEVEKIAIKMLVELYDVRRKAAEIEVAGDKLTKEHTKQYLDRLNKVESGVVSIRAVEEAEYDYKQACVDLDSSENALKEANVQLELVRLGSKHGLLGLEDLRIQTESRPHRGIK